MDVIQPELIKIGNRYYRKNPQKPKENQSTEMAPYREDDPIDWEDERETEDLDIQETARDFRLSVAIPVMFHRFIIGSRGRTKQQLELETSTKILVPPNGQTGPVIITAQDKRNIVSAKTRLDLIIESARKKCDMTHFISLPVRGEELTDRVKEFKEEVMEHCVGDRGLDASLYQSIEKLHMTVSVFVLADDREIDNAKVCLQNWYKSHPRVSPFQLELDGLEIMNDDPSSVDVLYIKMKNGSELDRLQQFVDEIHYFMCSNGFAQFDNRGVKLHITLMNSKFRDHSSSPDSERPAARETFDATNLLERYRDFNFGTVTLDEIHLSQRFRLGDDGFYWPTLLLTMK